VEDVGVVDVTHASERLAERAGDVADKRTGARLMSDRIRTQGKREGVRKIVNNDGTVSWGARLKYRDPESGKWRCWERNFATEREAVAARKAKQDEVKKGIETDRGGRTLGELLREFLITCERRGRRPTMLALYRHTIEHHILTHKVASLPLKDLTPQKLQRFYNEKQDAACGATALKQCHRVIHKALNDAMHMELVWRNVADVASPAPAKRGSRAGEPRSRREPWTPQELRRFLQVATENPYGQIWFLEVYTGVRRAELLGLRWQDVDFERKVLHIRQTVTLDMKGRVHIGPPKNEGSRRDVAISDEVADVLRDQQARVREHRKTCLKAGKSWTDNDLVFPAQNGNYIYPRNANRDDYRLVEKVGLRPIRLHDVRHSHASHLLDAGEDIAVVSQRLGHSRPSTTLDIYHHPGKGQHTKAAETFAALLKPSPDPHA
jgi:integrase